MTDLEQQRSIRMGDKQRQFVYDFDSTLARTSGLHVQSIENTMLKLTGRTIELTPEVVSRVKGKSSREIFDILFEHMGVSTTTDLIEQAITMRWQQMIELVQTMRVSDVLEDGVRELVRQMRQQNITAPIATNSAELFVNKFLQTVCVDGVPIADVFPDVVGEETILKYDLAQPQPAGSQFASASKPNPTHVHLAAQKVAQNPEMIVYVGDTDIDVQTVLNDPTMLGIIINREKATALRKKYEHSEVVFAGTLLSLLALTEDDLRGDDSTGYLG